MRSSLLPRRLQASRVCDACRQKQLQHQQRQQQRGIASSLSSLLAAPSSSSSSSSKPSAHHQPRQFPQHLQRTTRSICHSRALRSPPPIGGSAGGEAAEEAKVGEEKASSRENKKLPPTTTMMTHYDFFPGTLPAGPPPAGPFHVDVRALRREYLALQATAHPDRQPQARLKARAEALSARINEAFVTLANPFRRAVYVLDLKHHQHQHQHHQQQQQQQQQQRGLDSTSTGGGNGGGNGGGSSGRHDDETAKLDDPELLGLVLEAREQVEEARDEAELEVLGRENDARIAESEKVLEDAFARDDLDAAGREVVRLRYWVNIKESIDNWEKGKPVVLEH